MDLQLNGRRAPVTGSSAAIGEGAALVVPGRRAGLSVRSPKRYGLTAVRPTACWPARPTLGTARGLSAATGRAGAGILVNKAGASVSEGWDDAAPEDWPDLYTIHVERAG